LPWLEKIIFKIFVTTFDLFCFRNFVDEKLFSLLQTIIYIIAQKKVTNNIFSKKMWITEKSFCLQVLIFKYLKI